MAEILTPEQVVAIRLNQPLDDGLEELVTPIEQLCNSHEALRADRDSWQATVEELADKNVNKSLTQRHEMREAALQKKLAEARADIRALGEAMQRITNYNRDYDRHVENTVNYCLEQAEEALARPGVAKYVIQ